MKQMKADYLDAVKQQGAEPLKGALKEYFAKHTAIKAVGWCQYTPHFNDGDPCEFGLHSIYYSTKEVSAEQAEELDGRFDDAEGWKYGSGGVIPVTAGADFKELIDEDVFELAFGDHAYVIVTPEAIFVHEYEHD